nr:hypothetical protein [uncultured Clostridium sp.]
MVNKDLRTVLKPITDGLFGRQDIQKYKPPQFVKRPLEGMVSDLIKIEPVQWYGYAFSREPLNGIIQDKKRREWMERSLSCGREYAQKICRKYRTKDPRKLAEFMGVDISYPEYPEKTDRVLFAEYRAPNKICIYMDAVMKAKKLIERLEISGILTKEVDVSQLLLSHELFHYLEEENRHEIFTKTEKIRLWSLGFFHNDSNVIALSEIAAMGFAQEIMGIQYSPFLMDVVLVYGYSVEEASGLYEEMMEYAGNVPMPSDDDENICLI